MMLEDLKDGLSSLLKSLGNPGTPDQIGKLAENILEDEDEYLSTLAWIQQKQQDCQAQVRKIGLKDVLGSEWVSDPASGDITHKSGGFFKIIGVDVRTDQRESGRGWKQPMLDQGTRSSIAGFICKQTEVGFRYLVEAKFEPGNYGRVLISPSLQVTYSNLDRAHGGRRPHFAEFFDGSDPNVKCLYEQWMPEDGGRFFLKRVKYMIVEIPPEMDIQINDNFRWVSVNTLKRLLWKDNLVNPHVRSLLAIL